MKFGAIDIGSNAIRLLLVNVYETKHGPVFHKDTLLRVPVRLGEEAFLDGEFSEDKIELLIKTMSAFKHLMDIHKINSYKACATSAMRDAKNSVAVISRVAQETGIVIEIISGEKEAKNILQFPLQQLGLNPHDGYLYIDVGGGSTELVFFSEGKLIADHSFNIGTLRLLNNQVSDDDWKLMMAWIKTNKPILNKNIANRINALGVGGNINSAYKEFGKSDKMFLTNSTLKKILLHIDALSMAERIRDLGMKPDRADVIVPALRIYTNVMKWAGIEKIFIPKQGLSDGIIYELYHNYITKN